LRNYARYRAALRRPRGVRELAACAARDGRRCAHVAAVTASRYLVGLAVATHLQARADARARRVAAACAGGGAAASGGGDAAFAPISAPFAAWMVAQALLVTVFLSRPFSRMVSTIWRGPRDHVQFYLRIYAYYVVASAAVVAVFSPLPALLAAGRCGPPPRVAALAAALFRAAAWANLAAYLAVAGASLYVFAKANYALATVGDRASS